MKCLVTKLGGVIDNADLKKVGEFFIDFNPTGAVQKLRVQIANKSAVARVVGEGRLTDSAGSTTLSSVNIPASTDTWLYVVGAKRIALGEVASLKDIVLNTDANIILNLDELKYANSLISIIQSSNAIGDVASLAGKFFNQIDIINSSIVGEIGNINCNNITLTSCKKVSGRVNDLPHINILNLKNCTSVGGTTEAFSKGGATRLVLNGTAITGNISYLAMNPNLSVVDLSNTAITGDLSSLVNMTKLTTLMLPTSVTYTQADFNTLTSKGCSVSGGTKIG